MYNVKCTMDECVFCKIQNNEAPATFLYNSEKVMAIPDINPAAEVHILIMPKLHIPTFLDLNPVHKELMTEMTKVAQKLIKEKGMEGKYRMIFNGGILQHVPHLHWHLLGGERIREVE